MSDLAAYKREMAERAAAKLFCAPMCGVVQDALAVIRRHALRCDCMDAKLWDALRKLERGERV